MSKKKLTSWEKRRRRRAILLIRATLFCAFIVFLCFLFRAFICYDIVDLSEYCEITYGGYNHKGTVNVELDSAKVSDIVRGVKETYKKRIMHVHKCKDEDYNNFYNSLSVSVDVPENLSNGSTFTYTVNYDKNLARKIRLKVKNNKKEVTVSGLVTATVLRVDDLFKDVTLSYNGVSPLLTVELVNNSTSPFIRDIVFAIIDPKENYSVGDSIKVRAYFSEEACLEQHFAVEKPSEDCVKEYVVEGLPEYIQNVDELPQDIIDEAVKSAGNAFTDESALEFGLRVFTEGNVMYVIDPKTKKYTFRWKSFYPISAYFKVPEPEKAGKNGNSFNDIDICFGFVMTQADGKECKGEAVVRFTNICRLPDGTYEYDFSNAKIISASHFDSRIKKNVIENYKDNYSIDKLSIK